MSDRGYALGAAWQTQGSSVVSVAGDEVVVEDPTDFDSTGRVDVDGARYAYTRDPDALDGGGTLTLDPTPTDVDPGDTIAPVLGGQVVRDLVVYVSTDDEGDPAEIIVDYGQRDLWPEGDYDPPIPVVVSDDLTEIEDAPGMTPVRDAAMSNLRWQYDYATATGNVDTTIRLTYQPVPDTAVKVSWGGVGLHRDEWDFTDPWTIVVPAQGFHADDVFEAHYAYTDPTARPVVPASLTLIGYTTATVGGPVALPVGTEAGHLLVIAAANYAPSSAPATTDARILVQYHDVNATSIGGSPNGGGVLAAMGVADGSGSAVTVTSAGGDIAIILAVFEYTGDLNSLWTPLRDAVADGHNYAMTLPSGADMGIALLAGICGTTSAPFSNDTTGDWTQVTFLSGTGTKATAQICYTTGPHNGVFHGLSTPSIWSGMAIGIEEG